MSKSDKTCETIITERAHQSKLIAESGPAGEREWDVDGKLGGNSVPGEKSFIGAVSRESKGTDAIDLDGAKDVQGWKVEDDTGVKLADIEGKYIPPVSLAPKLVCSSIGFIFPCTPISRRAMPMTTC